MNRAKCMILAVTAAAMFMVTPVIGAEADVNQQGMQNQQGVAPTQNSGAPAAVGDQQSQQFGQNKGSQFNQNQGQVDPKFSAQNFQGNQGNQGFQGNQGSRQQQGNQFAAQNNQPGPPGPGGPQGQQGQQGQQQSTAFGVVIAVDNPDNCLRLRQSPSSQSPLIGCAQMNEKLPLTGQWSQDGRWLQMTNNAWVYASQVRTDLKPPQQARQMQPRQTAARGGDDDLEPPEIWNVPSGTAHRGYTDTGIVYGPGADMLYGGYGRRPGFGIGIRIR